MTYFNSCSCICHIQSPYPRWCAICKCDVRIKVSSYSFDESSAVKAEVTFLKGKIYKLEERLSHLESLIDEDEVCKIINDLHNRIDKVLKSTVGDKTG